MEERSEEMQMYYRLVGVFLRDTKFLNYSETILKGGRWDILAEEHIYPPRFQ